MKRWTVQRILGVVAIVVVGSVFFIGDTVLGQSDAVKELRRGAAQLADQTPLQINSSNIETSQLPTVVGRIIGNILSLLGVVFFILTLYAGFLWMFARGDESKATKAADIIKGAIAGLIVVLGSYALTNLVFDAVGLRDQKAITPVQTPDAPAPNTGVNERVEYCEQIEPIPTSFCAGVTCSNFLESSCTDPRNSDCCRWVAPPPVAGTCYPRVDTPECASENCSQYTESGCSTARGACCVWLTN